MGAGDAEPIIVLASGTPTYGAHYWRILELLRTGHSILVNADGTEVRVDPPVHPDTLSLLELNETNEVLADIFVADGHTVQ